MNRIITISREFGSGGRELGKRLSEILGITYLDKEIVEAVANETNMNSDYLDKKFDKCELVKGYSVAHSFSHISQISNSARLLAMQHKIIKKLASQGDCIIIGRGADAVLSELSPFKIFVYAYMPSKIERCKSREKQNENLTDKEIERNIQSIDKSRKTMHDLYSPYAWGDKRGYHLCVNTSQVNIKDIAPIIAEYILSFFKEQTV